MSEHYTDEQITTWLEAMDGPRTLDNSIFRDAFELAAPAIAKQQQARIAELEAVILHVGYERRGRAGETIICRECKKSTHSKKLSPAMTDIDHDKGCVTGEIGRKAYEQASAALSESEAQS